MRNVYVSILVNKNNSWEIVSTISRHRCVNHNIDFFLIFVIKKKKDLSLNLT